MAGAANVEGVPEEAKGAVRPAFGAGLGLFGGVIAIIVPVGAPSVSAHDPREILSLGSLLVRASGIRVPVGAVLPRRISPLVAAGGPLPWVTFFLLVTPILTVAALARVLVGRWTKTGPSPSVT